MPSGPASSQVDDPQGHSLPDGTGKTLTKCVMTPMSRGAILHPHGLRDSRWVENSSKFKESQIVLWRYNSRNIPELSTVSGGQKERWVRTTGASALSLLPWSLTLQPPSRAPHCSLPCLAVPLMTAHSGSACHIPTPKTETTWLTRQHREPAHRLLCMQELPGLEPVPANKAARGQAR